jgi:hypothetical protein
MEIDTMRIKTNWILVAGLAFTLAACTTEPETTVDPEADEATMEEPMITEHGPTRSLEESVEAAKSNLAERLEIPEAEIEAVDSRRVVWSDGAMGCPEPDMMYTQALVEGYYIVLAADGERFAYHAGRDGRPFYCPSDRSKSPPNDRSTY